MEPESKKVLSVGIDIGTTTSHLVFSHLTLRADPFAKSRKLRVAEREIIYRSPIHLTPLRKENTEIDIDALLSLIDADYHTAGLRYTDVDTGAVITTGESSRKNNAQKIIDTISSESGKFIATTTGPNFESIISAHGSGATQLSKDNKIGLIHTDIGGGTSNLAVIDNGNVTSTSCLNIGGRLIAYDEKRVITRLESTGKILLKHLKINLRRGNKLTVKDENRLCMLMASILVSELNREPSTPLTDKIRTVKPLDSDSLKAPLYYSFSGGVAEYIYGTEKTEYGDLGLKLGEAIKKLINDKKFRILEVPERIRATVIGASNFTLQVSGPTTFTSPSFKLPLKNIPVITVPIDPMGITSKNVEKAVVNALTKFDLFKTPHPVAVTIRGTFPMKIEVIKALGDGIAEALSIWFKENTPLVLVFEDDVGNSVGNVLKRKVANSNILSIDEIELFDGDFLDVGEPLEGNSSIYPIVVKSLVFS